MTSMTRRDDVSANEGVREYGNVNFADPVNKKYPIDTTKHILAAWSYINHAENAAKYDRVDVRLMKTRIKRAAKSHDIDIESDSK